MFGVKYLVLVILVAVSARVMGGQTSTPAGTVRTLLQYEKEHDNARDTTFNQRNLNIYRKWITPGLYKLFVIELARERHQAKLHPTDKPYFGDGMDFGPLKESCTENGRTYTQQFSLRKANTSGNTATVPVTFFYNKACGPGDSTVYRFKLVRRSSIWLIDDIDYGSKVTLQRDLRNAGK
jgi:hypothetical protein